MRHGEFAVMLLLALAVSAAVLTPSTAPVLGVTVLAAAQEAAAVEAALGLDRPPRRLIQQALAAEGFDPGVPDGLFGPRTRAAIRAWQAARGAAETGYLDGTQAELLMGTGAPPTGAVAVPPDTSAGTEVDPVQVANPPDPPDSDATTAASPPVPDASTGPALAAANCEGWDAADSSHWTFFRDTTVEEVTACLAAGDNVAARLNSNTPLHLAALSNDNPAVIEALLAAGADPAARDNDGRTPLHRAASRAEVLEALEALLAAAGAERCEIWNTTGFFRIATVADVTACLAAGADVEARDHNGRTPLHGAARYNENPAVVEALLAAGADVEARDDNGRTPLHGAASFNENPAVAEALLAAGAERCEIWNTRGFFRIATPTDVVACLAAGADVAARYHEGDTPLHWAAEHNENPAVVEALLAAGADIETRNRDQETPLHFAAGRNENPAVVEVLLAAGADIHAGARFTRQTPLHFAASRNENPAVVEVLLAAGADIAARDVSGRTPLHEAVVLNKNPAVVEALLAAGADVTVRDARGKTPLDMAGLDTQYQVVVEALLAAGADVTAGTLSVAASRGNLEIVEALLARADASARDSALYRAASIGVIELLLAAGADVMARGDNGRTPLHAQVNAFHTVIERLLAAGADVAARNVDGNTPLHGWSSSVSGGLKILLAAGADLEARNRVGRTPLHAVVDYDGSSGYPESRARAIGLLVAAGANLDARDDDGNTPLHLASAWASDRGRPEYRDDPPHAGAAIEALLEAGADPALRNAEGRTPWELAEQNEALKDSDVYWRLNDAQYNVPRQESR